MHFEIPASGNLKLRPSLAHRRQSWRILLADRSILTEGTISRVVVQKRLNPLVALYKKLNV